MSPMTQLLIAVAAIGCVQALQTCCISKIYFGKLKISRGEVKANSSQSVVTENKFELEYDADLQIQRDVGSIYSNADQSTHDYMVISDYRHGKRYIMVDHDPKCTVQQINPDDLTPHCVPSTLMWTGEYNVGSGMENMRVNSWNGISDNFVYSMQTTVNDCTPVSLTRFGTEADGTRVVENTLYVNVTQYSHSRPSVFDLPIQCRDLMPGPIGK